MEKKKKKKRRKKERTIVLTARVVHMSVLCVYVYLNEWEYDKLRN